MIREGTTEMGLQVQASYRHGLALGTPIYTFPAGTPTLQLPWVNSLFVYSYSTFTVKKKIIRVSVKFSLKYAF